VSSRNYEGTESRLFISVAALKNVSLEGKALVLGKWFTVSSSVWLEIKGQVAASPRRSGRAGVSGR
jgi:hypothetical protein